MSEENKSEIINVEDVNLKDKGKGNNITAPKVTLKTYFSFFLLLFLSLYFLMTLIYSNFLFLFVL